MLIRKEDIDVTGHPWLKKSGCYEQKPAKKVKIQSARRAQGEARPTAIIRSPRRPFGDPHPLCDFRRSSGSLARLVGPSHLV
jgi:hypothetical protein